MPDILLLTKYYRVAKRVWCCKECPLPCHFILVFMQAEDKAAARKEAEAEEKTAAKEAEKESKATAAKTDKETKKDSKSMKEDKAPAKSKV